MPALRNLKWEMYAQRIARDPEKPLREIYREIWPNNKASTATACPYQIRDKIRERIEEIRFEMSASACYDEGFLITKLLEIVNRCMQAVPHIGQNGKPTGVWKFEPKEAMRAIELLGYERNMFVRRSEIKTGALEPLAGTPDEIMEQLQALAAKLGYVLVPIREYHKKAETDEEAVDIH